MAAKGLTDEQVDRLLGSRVPGGSCARDWFLPHDTPRGLMNVRYVVRLLVEQAEIMKAEQAKESEDGKDQG